eukprot:gene10485-biopygen828
MDLRGNGMAEGARMIFPHSGQLRPLGGAHFPLPTAANERGGDFSGKRGPPSGPHAAAAACRAAEAASRAAEAACRAAEAASDAEDAAAGKAKIPSCPVTETRLPSIHTPPIAAPNPAPWRRCFSAVIRGSTRSRATVTSRGARGARATASWGALPAGRGYQKTGIRVDQTVHEGSPWFRIMTPPPPIPSAPVKVEYEVKEGGMV